jgi:Arc/MetJ-type ribon-helix-helix transcriptional regulator
VSSSASLLISIRLDPESQRHLRVLEASGLNRSEAIREALRGAAERLRQRDSVRKEAEMVAADQQDRFEMQEIAAFMESLRGEG